jgi:translation initiation factor 2 beta subunit (eIF-2beta)/eIF-5
MAIRGGAIINISGKTPVDDPEYRYRMPAVFGKIEGSGNGIKTVIPNIYDVGLSLHRNPAEVNKFFGCELGAQTTYSPDTYRAVVNGAHTDVALQALIHRYVEAYVLCPNCRLPETEYKIKNDVIFHKCAACGAKERLDMSHKLTTFILAQDKKAKKEAKKGDKKKEKKKDKNKDEGMCLITLHVISFITCSYFIFSLAMMKTTITVRRKKRKRRRTRIRRKRRRKRKGEKTTSRMPFSARRKTSFFVMRRTKNPLILRLALTMKAP